MGSTFVGNAENTDIAWVGAVIHPVSGPTLSNATLVAHADGRIAAIHAEAPPAGMATNDVSGLHLYPGLIASATTLGLIEIDAVRATVDTTEVGVFLPEAQAWQAVNPDSEVIPVTRANGIAYAEVVPAGAPVAGHSSVVCLAGWTIEQMVRQRLAALHVYWPSFILDLAPKSVRGDGWKSVEDQLKDRAKSLRDLDNDFDEAEAYLRLSQARAHDPGFRSTPAWEAMRPVLLGAVPVLIHADDVAQIRSAGAWLVRRKFRGAIVGGLDAARCAEFLATNHIPVVYTREFSLPSRDTDPYDVQYATPSRLQRAGVTVIFGDGQGTASFVRNLALAAGQAVAFGLPAEEALKGLTLYPATLFGLQASLGTLEPGKQADIVAADGDILDPKTSVKRMWISGKEVDLSSRHTRLYNRYRQRPKP